MNESMQAAVAAMIEKAISGIDAASNFLAAEIPDVIHQLLMWHMVKSAIMCMVGVSILIGTALILKRVFRKPEVDDTRSNSYKTYYKRTLVFDRDGDIDPGVVPVVASGILLTLTGACFINIEWLQIWIAPKVWLIEYAASLVK